MFEKILEKINKGENLSPLEMEIFRKAYTALQRFKKSKQIKFSSFERKRPIREVELGMRLGNDEVGVVLPNSSTLAVYKIPNGSEFKWYFRHDLKR